MGTGLKWPGHDAGQSPLLVPRLRMSGNIPTFSPNTSVLRAQGSLTVTSVDVEGIVNGLHFSRGGREKNTSG
jgi:hypothetical protein